LPLETNAKKSSSLLLQQALDLLFKFRHRFLKDFPDKLAVDIEVFMDKPIVFQQGIKSGMLSGIPCS